MSPFVHGVQGGRSSVCNVASLAAPGRTPAPRCAPNDEAQRVEANSPITTAVAPLAARRCLLQAAARALLAVGLLQVAPPALALDQQAEELVAGVLRQRALEAYSQRDFSSAVAALNELVSLEPEEARWREMRAMALVDGKNFVAGLADFDACLQLLGPGPSLDRARVLSGRGLAYEGISEWVPALQDYSAAIDEAAAVGRGADAYILNSRGNCHASLGEWKMAREDYLESARLFQTARREEGSMQMRLDGAVNAFSNAALMLAQLGDDAGAMLEFKSMARRAPGSADMRAALAALYWGQGEETQAEAEWEFACNSISVGCSKYRDVDWLSRIRRWPPVMVDRMRSFLALRSSGSSGEKR